MEVVIALGLFAVGLMGIVLMSSGLLRDNQASRHRSAAVRLAGSKLETLGQRAYGDIADGVEEDVDTVGISGPGIFKREVTVEEKSGPARKEVTVTVSWRVNGEHRVVLGTIFSP